MLTFSRLVRIANENGLNSCEELFLLLLAVRLDNWEAQKSSPDDSGHMLFGIGLCNIKPTLTDALFLFHLRVDKQGNTTFRNRPADELGTS